MLPILPAVIASVVAAQVEVRLDRFGAGDRWRAGDIVGIQVTLTSDRPEPTPVRVEWEIPDANGDLVENSRSLVLNPRQPVTRWLYGRVPPFRGGLGAFEPITLVRVFEERDGRRVTELASKRIKASDAQNRSVQISIEDDLIGIIGSNPSGLEGYEALPGGADQRPSLSTATVLARGIQPRDLPDRWEGLSGFQAIVWTEGAPASLSPEGAEALRAWIRRGGHLVIVLPEAGNPWALGSSTAHGLSSLLPSVPPQRHDAVPITRLLPILSKTRDLRNPTATMPIQTFDPAALDRGFEPLLALSSPRSLETGELQPVEGTLDGAIVAVQARSGHGRITIIGIDVDALNRRRLQARDLPQADVFWNRILGRRGDTPSPLDFQIWAESDPRRLVRSAGNSFTVEGDAIASRIGLSGRAALSLLGILLLFAVYWAIAGPLGWVALGRLGRQRDSWMLFVATAVAFTFVAWAFSRLSAESSPRIQHVTVLDWIAQGPGEPPSSAPRWARATSWFSASLPGYGSATVAIAPTTDERNLIGVWAVPPSGSRTTFPNPSRYEAPIGAADSIRVPARATSSEFEARWLGAVDPSWGTLPFSDGPAPIQQVVSWSVEPRVILRGSIIHRLPGTLRDVRVIHVTPFRTPLPRMVDPPDAPGAAARAPNAPAPPQQIQPSDAPPNYGRFVEIPSWEPGQVLDLGEELYGGNPQPPQAGGLASLSGAFFQRYYRPVAEATFMQGLFAGHASGLYQQLDMLGFYWMLQQPAYMMNPPREVSVGRILRTFGREIDLSPWSNRPCLIIVGFLEESACPVPITIDGRAPESRGLTVVRCIVPLPIDPALLPPSP